MVDKDQEGGGSVAGGLGIGVAASAATGTWQFKVAQRNAARYRSQTQDAKKAIDKLAKDSPMLVEANKVRGDWVRTRTAVDEAHYVKFTKVNPTAANSQWNAFWAHPNGGGVKLEAMGWEDLPAEVRHAALKGRGAEVEFAGKELTKALREDVLTNVVIPRIQRADAAIETAVARELKLGWKSLGPAAGTWVGVTAAIAGLVAGGLAYFVIPPRSWAKRIEDDRSKTITSLRTPDR